MKKLVPVLLLLMYFLFSAVERYHYQKQITELQMRADYKNLSVYMQGVKRGLEFKKNQQGHVPAKGGSP